MSFPPIPAAAAALPATAVAATRFAYEAQGPGGFRVTGSIDAPNAETAMLRLHGMGLQVGRFGPADEAAATHGAAGGNGSAAPGTGGKPLRGDDFVAFNEQLAHLTAAGMPVESGLRLIARDLRTGRLAATVQAVADELDRGTPLGDAFERHGARFPPLYGRLLDAGVRSGDLSGVLLNFGRHLQLVQRLRAALWRALSYPLTSIVALVVVLLFIGAYVLPGFRDLYEGFAGTTYTSYRNFRQVDEPMLTMPWPTHALLTISPALPWLAGGVLALLVAAWAGFAWARHRGREAALVDALGLQLPLVGRALRLNLVARWCDAMRIATTAGMPLPAAIDLAADAVRSPRLRRDGRALVDAIESGRPLASAAGALAILPATVPTSIDLAAGHRDLPGTMAALADLYERQAEQRVNAIPAVVTPALVIVVAATIGLIILALLLPLVKLMDNIAGSWFR